MLGDFVDIDVGYPFASRLFTTDAKGTRLLRGDNVSQGRLRWEGVKRWPVDQPIPSGLQMRVGDVVLAMDRPWIEAGLKWATIRAEDTPSLLVQRVARMRARGPLLQEYLRCLIASRAFTDHVLGLQTGSTVPHISGAQIASFPIRSLPRRPVQQAIAALRGALDDKIESNGRVAELSERLLATHSEATLEASVPLGALVFCDREMIVPGSGGEMIDHYSIPAFDAGRVADRCRAETVMSGKFVVHGPSILLSRLNPRVPRLWFAVPSDRPALCSTEFLVMRPRPTVSLGDIWLACSDPYFFAEMAQRATGTSGSHQRVRPEDALSIEVLDPRQVDPAVRAEADLLLRLAYQRRRESGTLSELRDALLPELLSGRLRVPEAEELVESLT